METKPGQQKKGDRKRLKAAEMWIWKRMSNIKWLKRKNNECQEKLKKKIINGVDISKKNQVNRSHYPRQ